MSHFLGHALNLENALKVTLFTLIFSTAIFKKGIKKNFFLKDFF
jgi:hypothetical protein